MPTVAHHHVHPEALPRPPVFGTAGQHRRVVDPDRKGALHRDEDLPIASRREKSLRVEDPLRHLHLRDGDAAVLRRRQDARNTRPHAVRCPDDRPRHWDLGRERAQAIGGRPVPERAGEPDALRAAHSTHDVGIVDAPRSLGLVVDFERPPVLEFSHGTPAEMARAREQPLECGAMLREEVGDGTAQSEQVTNGEPSDERRVRVRARRAALRCQDVEGARRAGIAVRLLGQSLRQARPHSEVGPDDGPIQSCPRARRLLRAPSRRQHLEESPPAELLGVVQFVGAVPEV